MALSFLFDPNKQFQSIGGMNEVGGFLRVFLNGTDDRATTYKNFDGTLNEADIVLDSYGRAVVIVDDTKTYRIEVYNRLGGLMWTVSNYKASDGSGGGSGTPVSVEGTVGEIDVYENTEGGVKHFVIGLASTIKNAIATLTMAVNGVANALNGKKDKQTPVSESGSTTKTLVGITQDQNGEISPEFDDIAFPDYSQRFNNIENEQAVDEKVIAAALNDLNARMESVEVAQNEKNIGDRTADSLDAQVLMVGGIPVKFRQAAKSLDGATNKTVTNISQDENGVITVTYSAISFPDWTSAINAAVATCEKLANKKTTVTGFESSNTFYPTIKAVVDFVNGMLQNLGGKLITDNGDPFTDSSDLPSTTPYGGVDISDKDYAYIQNTGTAERWSATVSGSSVTWQQEYAISIPVFTPAQQAAIDSGITATMVNDLKPVAFSGAYSDLTGKPTIPAPANNGSLTISQNNLPLVVFYANDSSIKFVDITTPTKTSDLSNDSGFLTEVTNDDISGTIADAHIASASTWNAKQNAISDLAEIRSGASAGASALQPSGNGSNVTSTFTAASSRNNISSGEKLSTIFGKIAKWFADLKSVAFSGSYSDLSGTPTIPEAATATPQAVSSSAGSAGSSNYFAKGDHVHKIVLDEGVNNGQVSIAGQSVSVKGWSTKQDALPTNTTPVNTYSINVSGTADHAIKSKIAYGSTSSSAASVTKSVTLANNIDYSERDFLVAVTFVNGNTHESYINLSFDNVSYTITDSRVKWIRAGETFLFALNTATTSDGKLVGELNTIASLAEKASGTTYTFTDNNGIAHSVNAYPYQSPTGVADTFRYNTQSFTNGTGSSLTKILTLNESGGLTLNWAQYVESRFDFIDMTIRVCGFYNSTNASAEVITIEPYKYSSSYISAGLPELSNYILLLNDGVTHQFSFTLHMRMSYKEFLASIGGVGTTLYLGFTFGASSSSSSKHSITFANIWTRVTYHGDHS